MRQGDYDIIIALLLCSVNQTAAATTTTVLVVVVVAAGQSQVQAPVDVNNKPKVHITLLHALHSFIHIVHVNHLDISGSRPPE
jgi:hypothetical protein